MRLKKILWIVAAVFSVNAYAQDQDTTVKQQQIQKILSDWRARSGIPAATLSIYMPGHNLPMTFASGSTTCTGGESLSEDTLYQAGSITKSFTSTIILKLESEGKLNINDPITKYLPQYSQWNDVTIRELLNHTSGIFNYTEAGRFNEIRKTQPQAQFTPEEIINIAAAHHDYFPAGKGWKYSNTNYVLAGMIIEKVTGKSMDEVMNYYLHGGMPINLSNTYYLSGLYSSNFMTKMAHGYSSNGQDVTGDNMSWACTAGAIVTTTQDLLTWWRGLFQGVILPEQQMNEMMVLVCEVTSATCRAGENAGHLTDGSIGKGYGLGIIQSSYGSERLGTVWWHNGSTRGYKALVMWYPKSDIYMALTIDRDPGYLLKPDLPIIQNVMNVLISNAEWHLAHPKPKRAIFHRIHHQKKVVVSSLHHKHHHQ